MYYIYNIYNYKPKPGCVVVIFKRKTHFSFSQIFRFSYPSSVCVDKALDQKLTYTAKN